MPELPEVETLRRGLMPWIEGQKIVGVQLNRPDLREPLPARMAARLTGARLLALRRRAKYLLADLSSGEVMLLHLGMSGRVLLSGQALSAAPLANYYHEHPAAQKHDHVVMDFENGVRLTFNDPRRFGLIDLFSAGAEVGHPRLAHLGPEPLAPEFDGPALAARLKGKKGPVKPVLMDAGVLAGVGNIYASEALFRAGIHPERAAGGLSARECQRLAGAIRDVLEAALEAGGSSLRDFQQADGALGLFQHRFQVYDQEGAACQKPRCKGQIAKIVQSGRASYFCPKCQVA